MHWLRSVLLIGERVVRKKTAREWIDALISHYEKFQPNAGQRIEVELQPSQLAKELGEPWPRRSHIWTAARTQPANEFTYRNRVLIATRPEKESRRRNLACEEVKPCERKSNSWIVERGSTATTTCLATTCKTAPAASGCVSRLARLRGQVRMRLHGIAWRLATAERNATEHNTDTETR